MAIITKIKHTNDYKMNKSLTECEAEYNDFYGKTQREIQRLYNDFYIDGKKYVRIQTFGSDERQVKGKQSQVIHIDRNTAKQLVELLKNFFNL